MDKFQGVPIPTTNKSTSTILPHNQPKMTKIVSGDTILFK